MENPVRQRNGRKRRLVNRLEDAAKDLNAVLLVLAIGLAILDLTCFLAVQIRSAMPPQAAAAPSLSQTKPGAAPGDKVTALAPPQPGAVTTGR
jgi:hypothetical protein